MLNAYTCHSEIDGAKCRVNLKPLGSGRLEAEDIYKHPRFHSFLIAQHDESGFYANFPFDELPLPFSSKISTALFCYPRK